VLEATSLCRRDRLVETLAARVLQEARSGGSRVLLHDGPGGLIQEGALRARGWPWTNQG
jgi:hypothetical protein